MHGIHGLAM